ncbi:MAG: hypothetical protein JKY71_01645 [Alphaproteobacteria bacterium]|nr:hypothetical protein [Alphaproteobacteria bacterium]
MSTSASPSFSEIKDREAHVRKDLLRIFERSKRRDQLVERHLDQTIGQGWVPLKVRFDERVIAYHMPAIGDTKAVISLNLGCEGSALTAAPSINQARKNGIAFMAFSMVTRDAAGGDTRQQIQASVAANAWNNGSELSPLHQLYDTDTLPTFLVPQSAASAMTLDNMTHKGFANRMNEKFDGIHFVVPFFDAATAGTVYPVEANSIGDRIKAELIRHSRSALWAAHANVFGKGQLGYGIDRYVVPGKTPSSRMPTRKEARSLQLYARDVMRKMEDLPADHPLYRMPMTSWMSDIDEASCPHSTRYVAELVGANVRTDTLRHMNLKKRMSWIISDIQSDLDMGETDKNLPPLTINRRPEPTAEDIIRQTGGHDPDVYESPIRPNVALIM